MNVFDKSHHVDVWCKDTWWPSLKSRYKIPTRNLLLIFDRILGRKEVDMAIVREIGPSTLVPSVSLQTLSTILTIRSCTWKWSKDLVFCQKLSSFLFNFDLMITQVIDTYTRSHVLIFCDTCTHCSHPHLPLVLQPQQSLWLIDHLLQSCQKHFKSICPTVSSMIKEQWLTIISRVECHSQ